MAAIANNGAHNNVNQFHVGRVAGEANNEADRIANQWHEAAGREAGHVWDVVLAPMPEPARTVVRDLVSVFNACVWVPWVVNPVDACLFGNHGRIR